MKTRFANAEDTEARDIARAETQRADIVARKFYAVIARIDEFFNAVDHVVFADKETAPCWAERWHQYLADGTVPAPQPSELSIVDDVQAEQEVTGCDLETDPA